MHDESAEKTRLLCTKYYLKEDLVMDYESLLKSVKEADKNQLKETIFYAQQKQVDEIKQMPVDDEIKKKLILMLDDRVFFEMLLVNALK